MGGGAEETGEGREEDEMSEAVETLNKFMVSASWSHSGLPLDGDRGPLQVAVVNPPRGPISKEDALNLAAYLVAMVGDEERFQEVLRAIQNT
jgi:hypothetical protein